MSYLERLMSRALAVPHESPNAISDPFAQVAVWALDTPDREAGQARTASTPPISSPPAVSPDRAVPPARTAPDPAAAAEDRAAPRGTEEPRPARAAAQRPQEAVRLPKSPVRPTAPMDVADDFMRSLTRPVTPDVPSPDTPESSAVSPTRVPAQPAGEAEPLRTPVRRAVVAPPTPPAIASPRAPRGRARDRAPAEPARAEPRAARPNPPAPLIPSASAARKTAPRTAARREELAHSVGILRFGLNQV